MTEYDAKWAANEEARRAYVAEHSLYRADDEHASCGVGLVVSMDGKRSRKVVENGINALKAVWHRGAVDADGKTGDGAGIHVQIPAPFFYDQVRRTGHEPHRDELLAVGQVFLPRTDHAAQETCRTIVESEVLRMGYYIYGWRHVPVNISVLGEKANATRPEIEQILISNSKGSWTKKPSNANFTSFAAASKRPPPRRRSARCIWHPCLADRSSTRA